MSILCYVVELVVMRSRDATECSRDTRPKGEWQKKVHEWNELLVKVLERPGKHQNELD